MLALGEANIVSEAVKPMLGAVAQNTLHPACPFVGLKLRRPRASQYIIKIIINNSILHNFLSKYSFPYYMVIN
jgi:hypothetical protein